MQVASGMRHTIGATGYEPRRDSQRVIEGAHAPRRSASAAEVRPVREVLQLPRLRATDLRIGGVYVTRAAPS